MTLTCSKCSRINPADAVYCYFDGIALNGQGRSGPVAVGSQPFVSPFVFSSGRSCRSFDELAMASQENWEEAKQALKQGYLGSFFGGIGRADLAQVAAEAASFPDADRGLDQLLAQLPSSVLDEPKLTISPREINLGQMKIGEDRRLELEMENQGMRLLYGTASSVNTPWITVGEGAGGEEKIFQFGDQLVLPIQIKGDKLRAGNKPLEGKIVIESNGGAETVIVRGEVPITPFPHGVLAGATSPRQIAEKANKKPKEAAVHFERGEVSEWYRSNGWTYPVQGPASSGLSAVQQFFEALGLTPAPKVRISTKAIDLSGAVGEPLQHVIEVRTKEKKPVYAHGTSNQDWLEVGRAKLRGRVAQITITIPSVPNFPGHTLTGKVVVQSNGNQRFVIPVTLSIDQGNAFDFDSPQSYAPPPPANPLKFDEEPAAPVPVVVDEAPEEPAPVPEVVEETVTASPPPPSIPQPLPPTPVSAPPPQQNARRRIQIQNRTPVVIHAIPAALLGLILVVLLVIDFATGGPRGDKVISADLKRDPKSGAFLLSGLKDPDVPLAVDFDLAARFGLVMRHVKDPDNPDQLKRLTSDSRGINNNTRIRVDGFDYLFGQRPGPGEWDQNLNFVLNPKQNLYGRIRGMSWAQQRIHVTQHVQLLPSQTGALDTCLVMYRIKNEEIDLAHKVGLRVMLDTFIGANDGVPFLIPGREDLVTTKEILSGSEVPSYIEAIENPEDKSNAGTVVRLGLSGINLPKPPPAEETFRLEAPERVVICGFPGNANQSWDWDFQSMKVTKDSCIALFWKEQELKAGEERFVGFTFGLADLDFSGEKSLVLSIPSNVYESEEFIVTAYVYDARDNQDVTIELPPGFQLAAGETESKRIKKGGKRTTVHWKVIAPKEKKTYSLKARSLGSGAVIKVIVKGKSFFG